MDVVMNGINAQVGTTYTTETFIGTGYYKTFYALVQRLQANEIKTSEIFLKLQQYFRVTNERLSRPRPTPKGIIDAIEAAKDSETGNSKKYVTSVKPPETGDAGKLFVCVDRNVDGDDYWEDTDGYADDKIEVCTVLKDSVAGGIVTQGDQVESLTLTNGQSFDWKYTLPTRTEILLKLTLTLSENNEVVIGDPEDVKTLLLANIAARYRLGKDFEPQRYFAVSDAPWTSEVKLEWSDDDGDNWYTDVEEMDFDKLFVCLLENTEVIED